MNKRVLEVMLVLCIFFLIISFFIKTIIPDLFIIEITNQKFLLIVSLINEYSILKYLVSSISSFFTYYIYVCACCRLRKLSIKQCILVIIVVVCAQFVYNKTSFGIHYGVCSMFLLPALFNASLKDTSLIYLVHGLNQILSLKIRGLGLFAEYSDFGQFLILLIDAYIWLILLWAVQVQNKEVGIWEQVALRITETKFNFLKKKLKGQNQ